MADIIIESNEQKWAIPDIWAHHLLSLSLFLLSPKRPVARGTHARPQHGSPDPLFSHAWAEEEEDREWGASQGKKVDVNFLLYAGILLHSKYREQSPITESVARASRH